MTLYDKLVSELTQLDARDEKRPGYNRYALSIMLGAAQEVDAAISKGVKPEKAFAENFNPTRGIHGIARRLGLNLDVQKGRWIYVEETLGGNGCAGKRFAN